MHIQKVLKISSLAVVCCLLIIYGFYWNEARKEVFFLCGNFAPGVTKADVTRQLDTANLSNYAVANTDKGSSILFSSQVNFSFYQCNIEIDKKGLVNKVRFSSLI